MRRVLVLASVLFACATSARAQDDGLVVPPPPGAALAAPEPTAPSPPPHVPELVVEPLLRAAEQDLAAGQAALALARASLASQSLPERSPLRVRADGLCVLAEQRRDPNADVPPADEVLAPMVVEAELDLRAGRVPLAVPRLDFALARLPAGSALRGRAEQLRAIAVASAPSPPGVPPAMYAPAPQPMTYGPPVAPRAPRDPDARGVGEAVELYITGGLLGLLTGAYIPWVASEQTAGTVAYTLSMVGTSAVFVVGVISLDLTGALRTGVAPTMSAAIRFGFANGMLSWGLAVAEGVDDPALSFSLVWGGAAVGALVGAVAGFGAQPRVDEARLVESAGIWGGLLGTSIAMITDYQSPTAGLLLSLVGLDAGLLAGIAAVAGGGRMPVGRTLFVDLGFLAGFGVGAALPMLYYYATRETPELPALGVGSLIGSVGGWALLYLLTDGWEGADEAPPVHLGAAPIEGGGLVTLGGRI
ncbi:MAG: hypothetical protein KF729_31470 [Sandaracinaceae bacterium]|nr:hypothetical protein [Sandaracinaceae bacterium]